MRQHTVIQWQKLSRYWYPAVEQLQDHHLVRHWVPLGSTWQVVDDINKKTAEFNGMSVPVTVMVDDKKNVTLTVGIPPTTALVMKEAGVEKGSGTPNTQVVGNLPLEAVIRIAKMKMESMLSYDLKTAAKEVMGTCVSVGVTVEGKTAKQAIAAVNAGEWDEQLA